MATETQEQQAPTNEPIDYDALSAQFGLGTDTTETSAEVPAVTDDTPPPETPPAETPPPEAVPDKKATNQEFARKRVEAKEIAKERDEWKSKYDEAQRVLAEREAKLNELEPQAVEYKTMAEQRAARVKELEESFKNEKALLPEDVIASVPEVQEAQKGFSSAAMGLFPRDLSNPDEGQADLRFDPAVMSDPSISSRVNGFINSWEKVEYEGKGTPQQRSDSQYVALSLIARDIGVPAESFVTKIINGTEYPVLPTTHPVYRHLTRAIPGFVEARQKLNEVRSSAVTNVRETMSKVTGQKVENSRRFVREFGLGLTGEELKSALVRQPENNVLQVMSILEEHQDLLSELKDESEKEVALNGVFRPQFDISEDDPKEHTRVANAHLQRVGRRTVYAPLGQVAAKLAVRQKARISELEKHIAELKAEVDAAARQGEPGVIGGAANDMGGNDDFGQYTEVARKLQLTK